jgi:hypothetical protein
MRTDVFSFILKALQYQGAVVVGWVAIALVQLAYLHSRGLDERAIEFRPGRVPGVNPGGVIAWTVGSAIGIYLIAAGHPTGVTWALPVTFVVAGGLYAAALLVARPGWFVTARPHDPRDEVTDAWQERILCEECERSYVAIEMDRRPESPHGPICSQCATGYGFHRAAQRAAG